MSSAGQRGLSVKPEKIALFCDTEKEAVIENTDADSIYEVPLLLREEGLDVITCQRTPGVRWPDDCMGNG